MDSKRRVLQISKISKIRVMGTISALDVNNGEKSGYLNNVGREIRHHAIAHGVLLCPVGNVLYLMPPYCTTENELDWISKRISQVLEKVTD
ncbi:MAG: aminotransferase class III-fold pyridoxal phosphate-dependent enzyme [Chamaesiphon sp.]|nr:aminotransferase class III-fold pyridoxal phosphate-dependent enzyme [Chamaesiphon sp.]